MFWKMMTAQVVAMVFAAVFVLMIRDFMRQTPDRPAPRTRWLYLVAPAALVVWALWLMLRELPLIHW